MIPAQALMRIRVIGALDPTTPSFRLVGACRLCGRVVFSSHINVQKALAAGVSLQDIALHYAEDHKSRTVEHLQAHGIQVQVEGIA